MPITTAALAVGGMESGPDFDLDIRIVETGPVIADLVRSTDDNCGSTCQSACTSCQS